MLRGRWLVLLVMVVAAAAFGCNKGDERPIENELQAWDLPITDVPEILPGQLNAVFEDRDGQVWLGTANGVVRYDPTKENWRVFSSFGGLPLGDVGVIYQDRNGILWFALEDGSLVSSDLHQGTWKSYALKGDERFTPRQIIEDPENGLWVFGFSLAARLQGANLAPVEGTCGEPFVVTLDSSGFFWAVDYDYEGEKWSLIRCDRSWNRIASFPTPDGIFDIVQDRAGTLWVGTAQGLFFLEPDAEQLEPVPTLPIQVSSIAEDQKGGLWIGTKEEVWRRAPESGDWIKVKAGVDSLKDIRNIKPVGDSEVWLLGPHGLFQAATIEAPTAVLVATVKEPSLSFRLTPVSDRLWVEGYRAMSLPAGSSQTRGISLRGFPIGGRVDFVEVDSLGDVWASSSGPIHRIDQSSGYWTTFPISVHESFHRAKNQFGSIWGGVFGFSGYRPGQEAWEEEMDGEPFFNNSVFHEDTQGQLWAAAQDLKRCDWQTRACTRIDLNPNPGRIQAIAESPPGTLWFGGEAGLVRHDRQTGQTRLVSPPSRSLGPVSAIEPVSQDDLWLSTPDALWRFTTSNESWTRFNLSGDFIAIREDPTRRNRLWLLGEDNSLTVYTPGGSSRRLSPEDLRISGDGRRLVTLPDASGAIWLAADGAVARQAWSSEGVPLRQEPFPLPGRERGLVAVSSYNGNEFVTWRTRPTGLQLTSSDTEAQPLDLGNGFPISALAAAPNGRAWLGQTMGGLMLWSRDGSFRRFGTKEGLPHATILDISQNPEADAPDAWVATNDGAARVDEKGVRKANPLPSGPVDAVLALPDGGAWLALNPLPTSLFMGPSTAVNLRPTAAFLQRAGPDGTIGRLNVPIQRGEVLDMALDPDGETVWIGTTAGLQRLYTEDGTSRVEEVSGKSLQQGAIRRLAVDPEGTVWMGLDGEGDVLASVVGFDPSSEESTPFDRKNGLPEADRIDSLSFTPDGDLVVLAGGKLVKGRVFVPSSIGTTTVILGVILALVLGSGTTYAFARAGSRRAEAERFRPLLEAAQDFFAAAGQAPRRQDGRTLLLDRDGGSSVPVRCLDGDLVRVEEVMAAFRALPKSADEGGVALGYLVYSREVDPAAWRQLDVYRLREGVVLIPVSLAFLRAKTAQGSARSALEDLRRRYLGRQDLFDVRNALDETRFFFGRRSLVDEMFDTLSRREHAGLIGQRKSGKTSLLNFLAQRLDAFPVIVFDFQILQRDDPAWPAHLLGQIVDSYDKWGQARLGESWAPPSREAVMSGPAFRTALKERQALREKFGDHQPLVVLFDEIERVLPPLSGVDADRRRDQAERFVTATAVLRALGQQGGERLLAMVVADRLPVFNRINSFGLEGVDTNPFYRFFREFFLRPLDPEECREMLVEIGAAMGLQMSPDLCERLYEDSGGAPALARQLASAAVQKSEGAALLTLEHYEEGLRSLREESGEVDSFFKENYWKPLRPAERRVLKLAALADGASDLEAPGPAKDAEGADIPERLELVEARRTLLATGMLEETATGHQVRGGLFRAWLAENLQWLEEDSSPR